MRGIKSIRRKVDREEVGKSFGWLSAYLVIGKEKYR